MQNEPGADLESQEAPGFAVQEANEITYIGIMAFSGSGQMHQLLQKVTKPSQKALTWQGYSSIMVDGVPGNLRAQKIERGIAS